ncbi:MAG: peptidoglycan-binding protein, partial [Clostridia bacterium]|nr:peptidoglycan-binding protein [Clostridia bacterium]
LTKGMYNNPEVKKMQQRLYELGWFNDVRDGDFGSGTQSAVKAFQQASGLSVTGIADGETLDAMYAENAIRTGNRITAAPADPNAGTAENAGE